MKANSFPIPSLRNGLTVAFQSIIYSRDTFGNVTVHGFTVTLGNTVTMGARTLYAASKEVYRETLALAHDAAEEMANARTISGRVRHEALSIDGPN